MTRSQEIGARTEWQARATVWPKLEAAHAERDTKIKHRRLELPWVPIEKEPRVRTEAGGAGGSLGALAAALTYDIMFGPDYGLAPARMLPASIDHLDAAALRLGHRDVTLIYRARRIDRLVACERQRLTSSPTSTYGTDFPFDFGLAA